ncbi:unnamed protein product [Strongylus vulgaris]|uniref:Uncharacterized protein n=1 Tax=Strongylus vulgaris TaxID=40348 RepID=A0A3P7J158_STRVU|nr:unnamed protein product [Strongylus vulgaris]
MSVPSPSCVAQPSSLCFLQGDYVAVDALCNFEKGVKIGVGGGTPSVVGAEHEKISMASSWHVLLVLNPWRPCSPTLVRRHLTLEM